MIGIIATMKIKEGTNEEFEEVASAGLVRVCRENPDGTSFLLLQGISRVRISRVVREEPYRIVAVEPIHSIIEAPLVESRQEIEKLIKEALPDAQVTINDLAGDGDHYAAHVVSSAFAGKSRVQQHQMVYQALQGRMGNELHALALQTSAPE